MPKVKEHECKECSKKFSKLSKLMKHSAIHQKGEINYDTSVLTLEDITEHQRQILQDAFEDKPVTEDTEKSDFVDGEPWTCQICGFTSDKVSELANHVKVPCHPAWFKDFLNSSFVQNYSAGPEKN